MKSYLPRVKGQNMFRPGSGNTVLFMGAENPYLQLPEISCREIIKVRSLTGGLNRGKNTVVGFLSSIFLCEGNKFYRGGVGGR